MAHIESADLAFMRDYKVYLDQAKMDFIHGMQPHVRNHYEMLYKKYLDKNFILTSWCGQCVIDMMKRIATLYDQSTELKHPEPSTGDDVADYNMDNFTLDSVATVDNSTVYKQTDASFSYVHPEQFATEMSQVKRKRGRPKKG